jgi:hypothetical protein
VRNCNIDKGLFLWTRRWEIGTNAVQAEDEKGSGFRRTRSGRADPHSYTPTFELDVGSSPELKKNASPTSIPGGSSFCFLTCQLCLCEVLINEGPAVAYFDGVNNVFTTSGLHVVLDGLERFSADAIAIVEND